VTAAAMEIGPYRPKERIAEGGMGTVYLATDTRTGDQVALKEVLKEPPDMTPADALERLVMERRGARVHKLFCASSQRVPQFYAEGETDKCFYVAMEFIDGETLSRLLARGPLPAARVMAIAEELCGFLEDAEGFAFHDEGELRHSFVHGDLTSHNIKINRRGEIKILDFGIAKGLRGEKTVHSWGKFEYMPPERLGESPDAMFDAATDRWALGVLLYEMLEGRRPFRGKSQIDLQRTMRAGAPPLSLSVPAPLRAIVARLLDFDPARRYTDAGAIRRDLEAYAAGTPTQAEVEVPPLPASMDDETRRTARPLDTAPTRRTRPDPGAAETMTARTPRPRRMRRWARGMVAGLMLIVAGNELVVARRAADATSRAATHPADTLVQAWDEYDSLASRGMFGVGVGSLRDALTRRTRDASEAVVRAHRQGTVVFSNRWARSRDVLERAVGANPQDRGLRAALRYAEGHLHRIDGDALSRKEPLQAQAEFTSAVSAFRAAAELRPSWPDPFLGLFRTFATSLADPDRAFDALSRAEQLGHIRTARETAQLAYAWDARGQALTRTAAGAEAPEMLARASQAFQQATTLYESIAAYNNARQEAARSGRRHAQVQRRLQELAP
jgi:serine/threonine protein kinase